jgi:hypothetical protein
MTSGYAPHPLRHGLVPRPSGGPCSRQVIVAAERASQFLWHYGALHWPLIAQATTLPRGEVKRDSQVVC